MRQTGDTIPEERIAQNLANIKARIDAAANKSGRDARSVRLIAVTKYSSMDETASLVRLGVSDLGESRIQDAEKKILVMNDTRLHWHLIGHLQSNKARQAVQLFQTIHSIDSERIVRAINQEAAKASRVIECLIELNTAGEASKFGLPPERAALLEFLKTCSELKSVLITGLMSMAPHAEHPEPTSRPVFKKVRQLLNEANTSGVYPHLLTELSMGMTQDFDIAVEEGATQVRVGSALFA